MSDIGLQIIVTTTEEETVYKSQLKMDGANMIEASMLLASLKILEGKIINYIDNIQPEYKVIE